MTLGALGVLISPATVNVSASITGDTYSGSGDWAITQATVYNGETLTVYGAITISSFGSLTLFNTHLTMDEAPVYNHNITVNAGFLKIGTDSILDTTNATAGIPNCEISHNGFAYVYASNATFENIYFYLSAAAGMWYIDNSTLIGSKVYNFAGAYGNFSSNVVQDLTAQYAITIAGTDVVCSGNSFSNITQTGGSLDLAGMINVYDLAYRARILKNNFPEVVHYPAINLYGANGAIVSGNVIANMTLDTAFTPLGAINVWGDGMLAGVRGNINNNTIKMVYGWTAWPVSYPSCGIRGMGDVPATAANNWTIVDNHIWSVFRRDTASEPPYGIYWCASNATISRNSIGNVTGTVDVGGNPEGIFVGGTITTSIDIRNVLRDVTVSYNWIGNVSGSSNGILIGAVTNGSEVNGVEVAYNTVDLVKGESNGIGMWYGNRYLYVHDNTINNVWRDSNGIRTSHNTSGSIIAENNVSIIASGTMVDHNVEGAITYAEYYDWWDANGDHIIFRDNNIAIIDQYSDYFPEYNFSYAQNNLGEPLTIIQNGSYLVQMTYSNITMRGFANLPLFYMNESATFDLKSLVVDGSSWETTYTRWNIGPTYSPNHWGFTKIQCNPTNFGLTTSDSINITITALNSNNLIDFTGEVGDGILDLTFTLSGLDSGVGYRVYVDGVLYYQQLKGFTDLSFTYSGPWSEHTFEVVAWDFTPGSSLQASFEYLIDGNMVTFTDKSYGGAVLWVWNFGDGTGSTAQSPTHKYIASGKYTVSLTVYDSDGYSSKASTEIELKLGPDFPIERNPSGWDIFVTDDLTISLSAIGLLVIGAITYVSAIFLPYFPVITPKGRKLIGAFMVGAGLYFLIFIDNSWMRF
jgi:hypothetical protein